VTSTFAPTVQEEAIMKIASEGHRWRDLSDEDHNFLYELGIFALISLIIVLLFQ
jgi:hypothetical protein